MKANRWHPSPASLKPAASLQAAVISTFRAIYHQVFQDELMVNHNLPIKIRAMRNIDDWCVFMLLTPWMLSRIYLRFNEADLAIPDSWDAASQADEPYQVIGPGVTLDLLSHEQRTHLNFHPQLGHYLIQPLIMRMEAFRSEHEVYQAWNRVIEQRDENIRKRQLECRWQEDVSRREFFTRLVSTAT